MLEMFKEITRAYEKREKISQSHSPMNSLYFNNVANQTKNMRKKKLIKSTIFIVQRPSIFADTNENYSHNDSQIIFFS